jgi:purine nucleosidase
VLLSCQVTLVALGPLTNVALACRLGEDAFTASVGRLVWMGGCTHAKGNVTTTAEFNIHQDPEAAHIVLQAFTHSTMVRQMTPHRAHRDGTVTGGEGEGRRGQPARVPNVR